MSENFTDGKKPKLEKSPNKESQNATFRGLVEKLFTEDAILGKDILDA